MAPSRGALMIKTEIDTSDLQQIVVRMPAIVKREVGDALDHVSLKFLKEFRATRLQGPPGVRGSSHGLFSRFTREFILPTANSSMGVAIFTKSKIARMHEAGATIRGVPGNRIPVPLSARTELFKQGGGLRKRFKDLNALKNIVPIKFGNQWFLTKVKKRSREVKPLFVLKDQVVLQARLGFYQLWQAMQGTIFEILAKRLTSGIKKEWSGGAVSFKV